MGNPLMIWLPFRFHDVDTVRFQFLTIKENLTSKLHRHNGGYPIIKQKLSGGDLSRAVICIKILL